MAYVSYDPAPAKPMGPPSVGAAPPTLDPKPTTTSHLTIRSGQSPLMAYMEGMTSAQQTAFRACLKKRGAAKRAGTYEGHPANDCRADILNPPAPAAPAPAAPAPMMPSAMPIAKAGFALPRWAIYAGAGLATFVVLRVVLK